MNIKIENIGIIEKANVRLDGLTIIAGENDTGKSTVGKILFSIIKGVNNHDREFKEEKFLKIENIIEEIYFKIRREISQNDNEIFLESLHSVHPNYLRKKLLSLFNVEDTEGIKNYLAEYKEKLLIVFDQINSERDFKKDIKDLDNTVLQLMEPEKYIFNSITATLNSEFSGELNNKKSKNKGIITYEENTEMILSCEIENNKPGTTVLSTTPVEIQDATIIESPLIFQMYKLISNSNIFLSTPFNVRRGYTSIPFHLKDLITKISDSTFYVSEELDVRNNILKKMNEIISGESMFDKDTEDFYFQRNIDNEKYSFNTSNVASGIKSFGIIQMLLKSQVLNDRSVLILDEPEIHLHPKWQVKYCEIITELVEIGVRVVINTHSPYIIQALKVLSEKKSLESKTNYYLAEESDTPYLRKIINVNNDLNKVFKKLSDPIQKLVWE